MTVPWLVAHGHDAPACYNCRDVVLLIDAQSVPAATGSVGAARDAIRPRSAAADLLYVSQPDLGYFLR